jgi:hypothetical protein
MLHRHQARPTAPVLVAALEKGRAVALFAIVHGSMADPAAYTRLAKELHRRGQRALLVALPVDRLQLTGPTTPVSSPSS